MTYFYWLPCLLNRKQYIFQHNIKFLNSRKIVDFFPSICERFFFFFLVLWPLSFQEGLQRFFFFLSHDICPYSTLVQSTLVLKLFSCYSPKINSCILQAFTICSFKINLPTDSNTFTLAILLIFHFTTMFITIFL